MVNFRQNVLERLLDIRCIQSGRLDKRQVVFCSECLSLFGWYCTQVPQITFVANKHDNNVAVSMIAQFPM